MGSKTNVIGLGATVRIRQEGKKLIIEALGEKEKVLSCREARELTPAQAKNYKFLGEARGQDFYHCLYLANRHCTDFKTRVTGYQFCKPRKKKFAMVIRFYENRKKN